MKKYLLIISLIVSVLALTFAACKKKTTEEEQPKPLPTHWYSPEPGPDGTLPQIVLPDSLVIPVTEYFTIHAGEAPTIFEDGQFVSSPHVLLHSTSPNDTITVFKDRYIAFIGNDEYIDFYGKQWDVQYNAYYEEVYRKLFVIGTGENFTTYYLTEGYPNGMYAKQSTVFSGQWNPEYGGLKNFQVAVILLETSGNPNLEPAGSFRVLGDGDGLAQDTNWLYEERGFNNDITISPEDAFSMFRVK